MSLGQLKQELRKLQSAEKGESNIVIVDSKGNKVSQVIPAGLSFKQGDTVKLIKH
jgi:hypothetical protein